MNLNKFIVFRSYKLGKLTVCVNASNKKLLNVYRNGWWREVKDV
jgi:hypothetical protein